MRSQLRTALAPGWRERLAHHWLSNRKVLLRRNDDRRPLVLDEHRWNQPSSGEVSSQSSCRCDITTRLERQDGPSTKHVGGTDRRVGAPALPRIVVAACLMASALAGVADEERLGARCAGWGVTGGLSGLVVIIWAGSGEGVRSLW